MNLRRHWCKHSLMCLFLKQQKNKTAFVRIQALISPPKCLWFRHNWELCERTAVHVACDTLGSTFLSSVHIGKLGTREVSLQLGGNMAPPHQPFILPGQPPPPPPADPPLPKLLEFKLTLADVRFGLLRATDNSFHTLRALAGTKQLFFFLSQSSWVSGHMPTPPHKLRAAENHARATS